MIFSLFAASIALNPYGACAHITGHEHPAVQKTCAMMRQAGMGWVRCDFHWHSVEKKKGEWDFSRFDGVVSECEAAGLQLLPILCYSVPWAYPAYRHLDSWEEYVRRVVSRYGRRLPVVEVWNEANLEQFWRNPNPTNYLALLRRTHETVKSVDPSIRVACEVETGVPAWGPVYGILSGGGTHRVSQEVAGTLLYVINPLRLRHLDRQPELPPRAKIITSGLGGIFPRGLVVGFLLDGPHEDESKLEREGEVEPAVDFPSLESVFICREN